MGKTQQLSVAIFILFAALDEKKRIQKGHIGRTRFNNLNSRIY